MRKTSAGEVIERYAGRSLAARAELGRWRGDPHKAEVVAVVEAHRTRMLYRLRPEDVLAVARRTEHALGDVQRVVGEGVSQIRDWHPAFAFTHVFHVAMEAHGGVPTYQEFRDYCRSDPAGRCMLEDPAWEAIDGAARDGVPRQRAIQAMRWRVGNAYYSFLRELHTVVELRALGLDARAHPLADALFRSDAWVGDVNLSLYIGNDRYRAQLRGRKPRPEALLGDARPPFRYVSIELNTRPRYGQVFLPERNNIEAAARAIWSTLADGNAASGH